MRWLFLVTELSRARGHCVEKEGISLSRFLRKNWKIFREDKTNAKLGQSTCKTTLENGK